MENQDLARYPQEPKPYCKRFGNARISLQGFKHLHGDYFNEPFPQAFVLAGTPYTSATFSLDAKLKKMISICCFYALLRVLLGLLSLGALGLTLLLAILIPSLKSFSP
jgi:hypothetical protein